MASQEAENMKQLLIMFREATLNQPIETLDVVQTRTMAETAMGMVGTMPEGVEVTDIVAGGVPALSIVPAGAADDRVLLYLHGGAYVMLSSRSHLKLTAHLAVAAGCRAVSIDYRMAPEHPHPAAVTDAVAAYRWLLEQGYAANRIAISGDSAGGGLTLATLVALREQGLPQPACAVPISPWTDLEGTGASMTTNVERDLLIPPQGMPRVVEMFLAGGDTRDPLASPLHADFRGLAPLYVQVGGDEVLLDDSTRVVVKAAHAGGDVRLDVFPEMQHVFQAAVGMLPEADDAVARIGAYLRDRFSRGA